jgi:phytoene dehydrogenase-like protein
MPSSDAIVIGGGPNGLACAVRLGQQGRKVTLLEAEDITGGGARPLSDLAPGYRSPALAHLVWHLDPRVEKAMDLARHGLTWAASNLPTTVLAPDGAHLSVSGGTTTGPDAAAWNRLYSRLSRMAERLEPFRRMAPPRLGGKGNDWLSLARHAIGLRTLGTQDFRELLRLLLINAHDVATDELTDPRLRALVCFDATLGAWAGPRSPNTLILWLDRLASQVAGQKQSLSLPKGGLPALSAAMTAAARAAGVTIRTGARVGKIEITGDRATGVTLTSGETLSAPLIVSAIGPKPTLLNLVGPAHLDTGMTTRLRHQKSRGGTAKLHLALSGTPDFRGADLRARLLLAPDEHAVEQAFNPVKYGETPAAPVMEIVLPSAFEPGLAPEGGHVLSANVQFAPHAPKDPDKARDAFLSACLAQLESAAPGIGQMILRAELLMPYDIESRFGMAGGNWHHGELSVEQMLFLRPLPELARYATPIPGLWLTGAGTHPGGMSGAAGWNAAEAIQEARA